MRVYSKNCPCYRYEPVIGSNLIPVQYGHEADVNVEAPISRQRQELLAGQDRQQNEGQVELRVERN